VQPLAERLAVVFFQALNATPVKSFIQSKGNGFEDLDDLPS